MPSPSPSPLSDFLNRKLLHLSYINDIARSSTRQNVTALGAGTINAAGRHGNDFSDLGIRQARSVPPKLAAKKGHNGAWPKRGSVTRKSLLQNSRKHPSTSSWRTVFILKSLPFSVHGEPVEPQTRLLQEPQKARIRGRVLLGGFPKIRIPPLGTVGRWSDPVEHSSQKLTGPRGSYPDQVKGFSNS